MPNQYSKKHGHCTNGKTKTYRTWLKMKSRCNNPNDIGWPLYGGRGIKVCEYWENSFSNFLKDMGEKPESRTLDRIDNDKSYSKVNCRWATKYEQARNKRSNRLITAFGKTQTLVEWSIEYGIKPDTISNRINIYGWDNETAVSTTKLWSRYEF